jgi:hypothetical protein
MSDTDSPSVEDGRTETQVLSKSVDWLVTAVLIFGGVLLGLVGLLFNVAADRAEIARLVAEGTIESTVLTEAELVDATYAFAWWGGLGLAAIGALLVVGGVAFFAYRRRTRRRRAELGITGPDTTTNAIVGAVVTVLVSFVPFSPVLGGAVAGYLEGGSRTQGARAGGLSGAVASLPIVLLFAFLIGGLVVAAAEISFGFGAGFVALILAISLLFAVAYMVLLSALGGYIGVYLSDERSTTDDHSPSA